VQGSVSVEIIGNRDARKAPDDDVARRTVAVAPHIEALSLENKQQKLAATQSSEKGSGSVANKEWIVQQYGYVEDEDEGSDDHQSHTEGTTTKSDDNTPKVQNNDNTPTPENESDSQQRPMQNVNERDLLQLEASIKLEESYLNDEASSYFRSKPETKDLQKKIRDLKQKSKKLSGIIAKEKRFQLQTEKEKEKISDDNDDIDNELEEGGNTFGMLFGGGESDDGDREDAGKPSKVSPPPAPVVQKPPSIPSDWNGNVPKKELEEYCKKRKLAMPKYRQFKNQENQHQFEYRVTVQTTPNARKGTALEIHHKGPYHSFKDAQHYLATEALYKLNPNRPLYRSFPRSFQDLWLSWLKEINDQKDLEAQQKENKQIDVLQSLLDDLTRVLNQRIVSCQSKATTQRQSDVDTHESDIRSWDDQASSGEDEAISSRRATPTPSKNLGFKLKQDFVVKMRSPAYLAMERGRASLPIYSYRTQLLETIQSSQITILCGETGCGKSTQCPQFVLEDLLLSAQGHGGSVICTQPRRISAVSLAERVADEMVCEVGDLVGYQIRMESKKSRNTKLLFCTTGVIIQRLQNDPELSGVSHIVVDEVHERQWQIDVLLVILRRLVAGKRPDLKVILMSATLDSTVFSRFFLDAPLVSVPGRTFPIAEYYLEDILDATGHVIEEGSQCARRGNEGISGQTTIWVTGKGGTKRREVVSLAVDPAERDENEPYSDYALSTRLSMGRVNESTLNYDLIEDVLSHVLLTPERNTDLLPPDQVTTTDSIMKNGATLIFLPGMGEIRTLRDRLLANRKFGDTSQFAVLVLHSSLSSTEQKKVFVTPKAGVRKIILSTNIAETSVTIPDVVCVIDTGLVREVRLNKRSHSSMLVKDWCSRSSAKQRQGRAGRVQQGICLKLYSYHTATQTMKEHAAPEIQRTPLEEVCLSILAGGTTKRCNEFLSELPEPPPLSSVNEALDLLEKVGASKTCQKSVSFSQGGTIETTTLTALGKKLARLPLDVRLAKMLLFGCFFGCIEAIVTIAACLSGKSPFSVPMDDAQQASAMHRKFEVPGSDFLTLSNVFDRFVKANRSFRFCRENFLSYNALTEINETRNHLISMLGDSGFLPRGTNSLNIASCTQNRNGGVEVLPSAVLCAGLYPNVACIVAATPPSTDVNKKRIMQDQELLQVHSSSVGVEKRTSGASAASQSPWLVFHERFETNKAYISCIGPTTPFALLLFGDSITVNHVARNVMVGDWIQLRAAAKTGVMFREIRKEFLCKMMNALDGKGIGPGSEFGDVVDMTVKLIKSEY
jgi:HrpA-like RNA helicase